MSYHNGSVWPHDNSLIASGFARYGHEDAIDRVFKGLFDASTHIDLRRLPELFCGFLAAARARTDLLSCRLFPQAGPQEHHFRSCNLLSVLNSTRTKTKFCCASRGFHHSLKR